MLCHHRLLSTALLAILLLCTACTSDTFVHQYKHTKHDGWRAADTINFEIPASPLTQEYDIYVGLRITNVFPYEGLSLVAETELHNPHAIQRDTVDYQTMDKDGLPTGRGVTRIQYERPISTLHLNKGQSGEMHIYHIMTREVIPGVTDVGLMLKPVSTSVNSKEDK